MLNGLTARYTKFLEWQEVITEGMYQGIENYCGAEY